MASSDPRSLPELMNALVAAQPEAERNDPERYRQAIYRRLAADDDPLLQEIGEQLRDGVIRPYQLLTEPAYVEVVARGLEWLREVDVDASRDELADLVDKAVRDRGDHR